MIPLYGQNKAGDAIDNVSGAPESIGAARTLTASDSGKTFFIEAAAFTITLPTGGGTAGMTYEFKISTAAASIVKIDGGAANMMKGIASDSSAAYNLIDNNQVHFVASAKVGDTVRLISTGKVWLVEGHSGLANGILGANS